MARDEYIYETVELPTIFGTYRVQVVQDYDPVNPREDFDNLGTMVCWHRRYNLGDREAAKTYGEPRDLMLELSGLDENSDWYQRKTEEMNSLQEMQFLFDYAQRHAVILQLYLYDHSGISMSCSSFIGRAHHAEWDSGPVGFIFLTHEDIRKEYSWKKLTEKRLLKIEEYLKSEVETYDQYLTGDVYGFRLYEPPTREALVEAGITEDEIDDDNIEDACGEAIDSCWGFFGHDWKKNGMEDHVYIQGVVRRKIAEHIEQLKTWIKNKVPVFHRQPLLESK